MTRKPRQISGNDPLAAIPKDYNRYCDKIIGNAGGLFLEPDVLARAEQIIADGGTVEDIAFWDSFVKYAKYNTIMPFWADIVAAYSPSWGVKGTTTASKLYSIISAGQDLAQTTGSKQPTITAGAVNGRTGLVFDGINDVLEGVFAYNNPATVISMGFKQITWTATDAFYDGAAVTNGLVRQSSGATPEIEFLVSGVASTQNTDLSVNTAAHLRTLMEATLNSEIQVDGNATVSDILIAAPNMAGFTLGARGDDLAAWSNINSCVEVLLDAAVDANYVAKMAALYAFSQGAYATP